MELEKSFKKNWMIPQVILISQTTVNNGSHAGAHEHTVLPGGTTTSIGGQHFDIFRTTQNFHLFTHTVPVASGPATNFFAS